MPAEALQEHWRRNRTTDSPGGRFQGTYAGKVTYYRTAADTSRSSTVLGFHCPTSVSVVDDVLLSKFAAASDESEKSPIDRLLLPLQDNLSYSNAGLETGAGFRYAVFRDDLERLFAEQFPITKTSSPDVVRIEVHSVYDAESFD